MAGQRDEAPEAASPVVLRCVSRLVDGHARNAMAADEFQPGPDVAIRSSFLLMRDDLPPGADLAPVALRLFVGTFLIYMSHDNVLSGERMSEFVGFLRQFGFPAPELMAPLSVYAQFTAGIALLVGFMTRAAAAVMIVNFLVALALVHPKLPFREALDPSAMLACSIALLLLGGGRWSLDRLMFRGQEPSHKMNAAAAP